MWCLLAAMLIKARGFSRSGSVPSYARRGGAMSS
jgi:hypothetical protein